MSNYHQFRVHYLIEIRGGTRNYTRKYVRDYYTRGKRGDDERRSAQGRVYIIMSYYYQLYLLIRKASPWGCHLPFDIPMTRALRRVKIHAPVISILSQDTVKLLEHFTNDIFANWMTRSAPTLKLGYGTQSSHVPPIRRKWRIVSGWKQKRNAAISKNTVITNHAL